MVMSLLETGAVADALEALCQGPSPPDVLGGAPLANVAALSQLAVALQELEDHSASGLCAGLRDRGAIASIIDYARDDEPAVHRPALLLLALLTTTDVDDTAGVASTLKVLKRSGALDAVVPRLFSSEAFTVAAACAVCQNICVDFDLSVALLASGALSRLNELTCCDQQAVCQAAQGCLHNLEATAAIAAQGLNAAAKLLQRTMRSYIHHRKKLGTCQPGRLDIARAARCLSLCATPAPPPPGAAAHDMPSSRLPCGLQPFRPAGHPIVTPLSPRAPPTLVD